MKKIALTVLAQILVAGVLLHSSPASATPVSDSRRTLEQADFLNRINALRASHGEGPVILDDVLTNNAQIWAQKMAREGRLQHQTLAANMFGSSARAENVALGKDIPSMQSRLVLSPTHVRNTLNFRYNAIGIGIARGANGSLYAAHEYARF